MDPIKTVQELKASYKRLPGIGEKTAERLAYATLGFDREAIERFIAALGDVTAKVHVCPDCGLFIDTAECPVCSDPERDRSTLLVVTDIKNVISFEKTGTYRGLYFVLGGSISLIKDMTPEKLRIPELRRRVEEGGIKEVILACSSTMEGETTSLYIAKVLKPSGVKVTRLASGVPFGADLEYVDEQTIARSLSHRTPLEGDDL